MGRLIAIGDVHGCRQALDGLLAALRPDPSDVVVTLGDYVDRGPDSHGVIERLIELDEQCLLVPLRGNHEQMMRGARHSAKELARWLPNGGKTTMASYGLPPTSKAMRQLPTSHQEFLDYRCRDFAAIGPWLFVHAGAEPDLPPHRLSLAALNWMEFTDIEPRVDGRVVICGHSAVRDVTFRRHAVCIDTGMGKWPDARLTALDLTRGLVVQADTAGRTFRRQVRLA